MIPRLFLEQFLVKGQGLQGNTSLQSVLRTVAAASTASAYGPAQLPCNALSDNSSVEARSSPNQQHNAPGGASQCASTSGRQPLSQNMLRISEPTRSYLLGSPRLPANASTRHMSSSSSGTNNSDPGTGSSSESAGGASQGQAAGGKEIRMSLQEALTKLVSTRPAYTVCKTHYEIRTAGARTEITRAPTRNSMLLTGRALMTMHRWMLLLRWWSRTT